MEACDIRKRALAVGTFLLFGAILGISYKLTPLYSGNQTFYFVYVLAKAGYGFLGHDWLAHTANPFPGFTFLATWIYRLCGPWMFYVCNILLFAVYVAGMVGIVNYLYQIDRSKSRYLMFMALLVIAHSPPLSGLVTKHLGFGVPIWNLQQGVAGNNMLDTVFLPSAFSVFFVLSIAAFLHGKTYLSVLFAAVPAWFHGCTAFILCDALLTGSYVFLTIRADKNTRQALRMSLLSVALALPPVLYLALVFHPTSLAAYRESLDIQVHFRAPQHHDPRVWLGLSAYVKLIVAAIALIAVRRTRLFPIMAVLILTVVCSTLAQMALHSNTIAMALPWRVSVVVMPISVCVLAAYLTDRAHALLVRRGQRSLVFAGVISSIVLLSVPVIGIRSMGYDFRYQRHSPESRMAAFVKTHARRDDIYLISTRLDGFRTMTGASAFVDWKCAPFKDVEALEWWRRVKMADSFYNGGHRANWGVLKSLTAEYGITHVVLKGDERNSLDPSVHELYRDNEYSVCKISRVSDPDRGISSSHIVTVSRDL